MTHSTSASGGYEGSHVTLQLDSNKGSLITYTYQMYTIPDRMIIRYDGNTILDTGFVSDGYTGTIRIGPGTATELDIVLATDDVGTAWDYSVSATGSPNTSPFILAGDYQQNQSNQKYEAPGPITIGREDGINAMMTASGPSSYDETAFIASGAMAVLISGSSATLFSGSFTMPFASGVASAVADTGNNAAGEMKIGGLDFNAQSLSIFPDSVRAGVQFELPSELGSQGLTGIALIFKDNTTSLGVSGKVLIPDFDFSFFSLFHVDASSQSLSYDVVSQTLKYQGELKAEKFAKFIPDTTITLDLKDNNYVSVSPSGVNFVGKMTIERELKDGVWGFKQFELAVDTIQHKVTGGVTVGVPFGPGTIDISGTLGFIYSPSFDLNTIGLTVGPGFDKPLPFSPEIFLQAVGGTVDHIAKSDTNPVSFTGTVQLTLGPNVTHLATFDLSATIDSQHLGGSGSLTLVSSHVFKSTSAFDFNWNGGYIQVTGSTNVFDGFITAGNDFKADTHFNFGFGGIAQVKFPDFIPFLGGETAASADYRVQFTNDGDLSNDYAAAWVQKTFMVFGNQHTAVLGARLFFNGHPQIIGVGDIPQAPGSHATAALDGAETSTIVPSGLPLIYLSASWQTDHAADVALRVHHDGTTINEANFAANGIDIIEELGTHFSKTLAVQNPGAGDWSVEVVDPTGLGTVTTYVNADNTAPTLAMDAVSGPNGSGDVTIGYTAVDPDSTATLTLYADTNNSGFDGIQIASGILEADGHATYTWHTNGIAPGTYSIYGVLNDQVNADVMTYASGTVTLTNSADLSVTVAGPTDTVHFGDSITYTINVHNNGTSSASNVSVTDLLPVGVTYTSSSIATSAQNNSLLTFNLGTLASGASTQFTVTGLIGSGGTGLANATLLDGQFKLQTDPDVQNSATVPHATVVAHGADKVDYYSFTVTQANAHGIFDIDHTTNSLDSYIRVLNGSGTTLAFDDDTSSDPGSTYFRDSFVQYTFTQPGTYYVGVFSYPGNATSVVPAGHDYQLNVTLDGALTSSVSAPTAANTVTVSSSTYDPNLANNSDFAQNLPQAVEVPTTDLAVSATSLPATLNVGDQIDFTVTVTNTGASAASNVVLTEFLNNVANVVVTESQGNDSVSNNKYTVAIGTLAAGAHATVEFSGVATAAGAIYSTGEVTSSANDSNPNNDTFSQSAIVSATGTPPADLSVNLGSTYSDSLQQQTVTITLANAGPGVASGVQVSIPLPTDVSVISQDTVQGTYDPATGIWDVGSLSNGIDRVLTLVLDSKHPVIIPLTAEVSAVNEQDPDSVANNHVAGEDDQSSANIVVGHFSVDSQSNDGAFGDFDHNGSDELLWRNTDGSVATWSFSGSTPTGHFLPTVPTSWHMLGAGDFDGDGHSDVLWQNDDHSILYWKMTDAASFSATPFLDPAPTNEYLAGIGDVTGDSKSDLLWRNITTGAVRVANIADGTSNTITGVDNAWSVVGVGDYNGDHMADVMFRNTSLGVNAAWLMNGTASPTTVFFPGVPNDWHVVGSGDFDGNGVTDLFWHNDNGSNAVWLLNSSAGVQQAGFFDGVAADWHVVGTGDFNNDQHDDVIWRDGSGATAVWQMNGANTPVVSFPGGVPLAWSTQAHHYDYV